MLNLSEFFSGGKNKTLVSSAAIRVFDFLFSGISLLLMLPTFLLIALLIRFSSSGPIFSKVQCLGRDKLLFNLIKFRCSVINNTGQKQGISIPNKPYLSHLRQFLRRTRLNNIPMLINVLRGEMSIVGPPLFSPNDLQFFKPKQQRIFKVRPGIINPSSSLYLQNPLFSDQGDRKSSYRNQILSQQLAIDFKYLENRTVWKDIALILKSTFIIVSKPFYQNSVLNLRNRYIFLIDIIMLLIIPHIAFTIRLDSMNWLTELYPALLLFTALALAVKLPLFYYTGLYRRNWRYASVDDLTLVFLATSLAGIILIGFSITSHQIFTFSQFGLPRSVPFIDFMLTFFAVGGIRFGLRGVNHWNNLFRSTAVGKRVLIVGAGEAGSLIVREIRNNLKLKVKPIAFVDDDTGKVGRHIQGLPVAGTTENISEIVKKYNIEQILIAMPSVPLAIRRRIIDKCKSTGVATDSLPGIYEILAGYKTISRFPEIDINLLLHREAVTIDQSAVTKSLKGSTVLVTGAGGSIGSELCRQIARAEPGQIILLGHGENSIFEINLDLCLSHPSLKLYPVIADIRNHKRIMQVFEKYRPNIVFHAAAHKHVPLMEDNVEEAISNNILGTQNVLVASKQFGVERFILISTDKAIRPSSIMGASKRIAELLTIATAKRTNHAYMVVRFGNVLGSRGSVIPLFQRQIAAGGPVTVTHKKMLRYFMTIPEATQLVLQANTFGNNGELFLLDMGEPVRIHDLAVNLIQLSGLKPNKDIKIVYSGVRPGEKLREELFESSETYRTTKHKKIFIVNNQVNIDEKSLEKDIFELCNLIEQMKYKLAKAHIQTIIHKYQDQTFVPTISKNQILLPKVVASERA